MEQIMKLLTASDCTANSGLTGHKKAHKCALPARWRSGDAEDCKSLHPGSIPGRASTKFSVKDGSDAPYAAARPKS